MTSDRLSNEDIRRKLLELNYNCGPVTDTTRDVHLKKLQELRAKARGDGRKRKDGKDDDTITDEELRAQLVSFGQTVAPINATNRHIYLRRLKNLKETGSVTGSTKGDGDDDEGSDGTDSDVCEPMEIDYYV